MVKVIREGSDEAKAPSPGEFEAMLKESEDAGFVLPGEIVTGTVVRVGREWVFVDLGGKSEGVIAVQEFAGEEEGEITVKVGDEVEATVLTTRGGVRLSVKLQRSDQNMDVLRDAFESEIPVEGRVIETNRGGFRVDIGEQRAFCPVSQIDLNYVENPEQFVGQLYHFRIIEFNIEQGNIVVSRRIILEQERKVLAAQVREGLKPGQILTGVVKKLMPFGAFVDIGGLDGLVHISEIAWERIENPADYLTEGQRIQVKVLKFEEDRDRLALSIKEATRDPWSTVEENWPVGSFIDGLVTRLERFGAFVRVTPGVEGLVHISDMTWAGRVRHPSDLLSEGQTIRVQVLSVDMAQRRLSLGMKQVDGDPWSEVAERFPMGSMVQGTVERIGGGGVFITLDIGITAFLPGSLAGLSQGEPLGGTFRPGKQVTLKVKEIDVERRRITLAAGDAAGGEELRDTRQYLEQQVRAERQDDGLGTFGRLLEQALKKEPTPDKD
ncbi:MAG: 30S ribosomal protein S1 [Pseudomonadota bacterium]